MPYSVPASRIAALSGVAALVCVFCQSICTAADSASAAKLGPMGSVIVSCHEGVSSAIGSVGLSIKRAGDTARVALSSDGTSYVLSGDVRSRRSLAMVGMVSTALEARTCFASGACPSPDSLLYLDANGALGNVMVSGRLFSIGDEFADAGSPVDALSSASGVGVMPSGFARTRGGKTGAGLGFRVRATDVVALSGNVDWGWARGQNSSLDTSVVCDVSSAVPGVVSVGLESRLLGGSSHTAIGAYSLGLGSSGLLKVSASRLLGLDSAPVAYSVGLRNDWERFYIGARVGRAVAVGAETTAALDLGSSSAGNPRLSLGHEFGGERTTSLGLSFRF